MAARNAGVKIPTLCHDDRLEPYGGCRLCSVEVKGVPRLLPACTTPVARKMEVITESETITRIRKRLVSLMLSNHPNDCMRCEKAGECALQDLAYEYGVDGSEYGGERWDLPIRKANPFIVYDPNKCVTCGRCIRICNEVVMAGTIDWVGRGFHTYPDTAFRKPRSLSNCEFCGQCVSTCPTGALIDKKGIGKGRVNELKRVKTTCTYCGTGCNITVHAKDNEILKIASKAQTWNEGWLCVKGRFGYRFVNNPERLTSPLIKKNGEFEEASWEEALDRVGRRIIEIRDKYGADAIGGLSSARCTNEENYAFQKLIRAGIGTNNVDHCARL